MGLWAGVAFGIPVLILVASLSLGYGKLTPQARAALHAIDFTTYEPRPLPPGFTTTRVEPTNDGVRPDAEKRLQRRAFGTRFLDASGGSRIAGIPGTGDHCPVCRIDRPLPRAALSEGYSGQRQGARPTRAGRDRPARRHDREPPVPRADRRRRPR